MHSECLPHSRTALLCRTYIPAGCWVTCSIKTAFLPRSFRFQPNLDQLQTATDIIQHTELLHQPPLRAGRKTNPATLLIRFIYTQELVITQKKVIRLVDSPFLFLTSELATLIRYCSYSNNPKSKRSIDVRK